MKTFTRQLIVVASLLTLALSASAMAQYLYTVENGSLTITGYTGPGGAVTLPDTIDGLPVARIGNDAFKYNQTLTSVTIPNGITAVGQRAFYDCANLTRIIIGGGVTSIGVFAFEGCASLDAITVNASNPAYSSVEGVLFNKTRTYLCKYPPKKVGTDYTIPDTVTRLESDAFGNCTNLTEMTIPENVTEIVNDVFEGCSGLTKVTICGDLKYIGTALFRFCTSLKEVYFKGNEPWAITFDVFDYANPDTIVYYLTGTRGWGATSWYGRPTKSWGIKARTGSSRDYPYTAFDSEEGMPKKIGLPEYRINTASLNVSLEATLFYMRTLGSPVNIRLAYNSAPTPDGATTIGLFGKNWRFRYESMIVIGQFSTKAQVVTSGGRPLIYTTEDGQNLSTATAANPMTLVPPTGVFDKLMFYGPGQYFEFHEKASKVTYRFAVSGGPANSIWRMTRITDRSGNRINLAVDGATGRITTITDPANRVVTLAYKPGVNLCASITTPDARRVSFTYDAHQNLTGITDMAGYVGSYTYDDKGFLTRMTTSGRQNTFSYIDRPGFEAGTGAPENIGDKIIASVTNAKGQITKYEMLANNAGVKRTDPKGGSTIFNISEEQTSKVADPLGNISEMKYNGYKLPYSFTDSNGKVTTYAHDANGNLITTTDALSNKTSMTYDSRDNLVSRTDALGNAWSYTYDNNDRVTSVQSPLGNKTQLTYLANGRLSMSADARNNKTSSLYDEYGNLTRVTDPLAKTTEFDYDDMGLHCVSLTDQRGKIKTMEYDNNDRLTNIIYDSVAGLPERVNAFDAFGQTSLTDELGQVTSVTRNEFGYITSVTDPLGNSASTDYDPNNNPVRVTDPLGHATTTTYDATNRPLVSTNPLANTVKREYDADGNMLSLTDTRNNKTVFKYDANNRLIETKDPLQKTVMHGLDALGRIATLTNARGQVIRYTYDADGRITKNEAQETVGGSFVQKAVFTYDPNGNLLSRTDGWGKTSFTYDSRDQPKAMTYPTGKVVSYSYSSTGQVASITYPNGLTVKYTYDNYNRLVIPERFRNAAGAELQGGGERQNNITRLEMVLGGVTKTFAFAYDKAGNRLSATLPNTTSTAYVYDNAQRLTSVLHKAGANTLVKCDLTYNKLGSITQEALSGGAQVAPGLPAADTTTYDVCNQVTLRNSKAYTYDADGNLTTIAGGEFSAKYTPENRPSQITRRRDAATMETIQYTYDASGLRVKRSVVGGATTQFHYGPDGRLLFTTDSAGNVTASFVWNGPLLAAVLTGSSLNTDLRYPHLNRLGNVMALTDSTGAPTVKYAYQPYGFTYQETVPAGKADSNLLTFVGGLGVQDEGGGLFYMKNRFYDANTGRFVQRDPIGFGGGFNLYAYVGNNPVTGIDPEGLLPMDSPGWDRVSDAVHEMDPEIKKGVAMVGGFAMLLPTSTIIASVVVSVDAFAIVEMLGDGATTMALAHLGTEYFNDHYEEEIAARKRAKVQSKLDALEKDIRRRFAGKLE